jgi:sugar phosphate isomerase/epimerase
MTLGMGYLTLGDLNPFDMVEAAGAGGFKEAGVRLTGHQPGDPWPFDPADPSHVTRMAGVARAAGVRLSNACTYRFTPETDPADYAPVLAACAALGVGTMIANAACADGPLVARNLAAVADIAAGQGIRIALEFIPVSTIPDLASALAMIEAAGRPNIGLAIDALHLARSGGDPRDLATVPPERLLVVQLCDGPGAAPATIEARYQEMRAGRLLPGEGAFDLAALLRAMPPDVEVEAEVPNADFAHLPPAERAARVRRGVQAFLDGQEARAPASAQV